jgi:hypothetical protein
MNTQICFFLENTPVKIIEDGNIKYISIQNVAKNTKIITHLGTYSTVLCLIKMKYTGPVYRKVNVDNTSTLTAITSHQPIFKKNTEHDEDWYFPYESSNFKKENVTNSYIYNLILNKGHIVELFGNIYASTLNHGKIGKIIEHPYFGTDLIQNDLMKFSTWNSGFIKLYDYEFIIDENTNTIMGIINTD